MLSVDWSGMMDQIFSYASMVLTFMTPIIGITSGFALGFGIANKIGSLLAKAI